MSPNQHEPRGERKKITVNLPSTAQRLTEQETIPQSINDNLISKYHSILCKFWYILLQHESLVRTVRTMHAWLCSDLACVYTTARVPV